MTKDIMQIMERRAEIKALINKIKKDTSEQVEKLTKEDCELKILESIFENDIANIHYIQIAESVLHVSGDGVDTLVDDRKLTEAAALDIATGCNHIKKRFFGNKIYESFYQACDCGYGYGPSHGSICDEIGLRNPSRELTREEAEACIYYLKNYSKIKALKKQESFS